MSNRITSLFLTLTRACNLPCTYCSADAGPAHTERMALDDALHAVSSWICGLTEARGHLVLTGGEPTLWGYPNLDVLAGEVALLAASTGKTIELGIQTNGTRVDNDFIAWCRRWNVKPSVSIDGPPRLSDGHRGLGHRTEQGLRRLASEGIEFGVVVCLTREVCENIDEVLDWLEAQGVAKVRINDLGSPPEGRSVFALDANAIVHARVRILTRMLRDPTGNLREHNMLRALGYARQFWETGVIAKSHCDDLKCGAGLHMASVNPDGRWTLCVERSMTGGTTTTTLDEMPAARVAFWAGRDNWQGCADCAARVICDQGCVAYHRMSHGAFAEQCAANKVLWRRIEALRPLLTGVGVADG